MPFSRQIIPHVLFVFAPVVAIAQWSQHGGDAQHSGVSPVAIQDLSTVRWSTPVDDNITTEPILIHYGSPVATAENTIVVPVRSTGGTFRLEARSGSDGTLLWGLDTEFRTAPSNGSWTPSFSPAITSSGALYFQGAGGSIYRISDPNATAVAPQQLTFLSDYEANKAEYDAKVFISTPITSDAAGNIYYGYEVLGSVSTGLTSGIARIAPDGTASHVAASTIAGPSGSVGLRLGTNSAPALSLDGSKLYLGLQGSTVDYLAAIDSTTLTPLHRVALAGTISDAATSSPTVGPDGHVYFGTLGGPGSYHFRGTLNHFSGDLSQTFTPGSFGWDETISIVDADMVPSYTGTSEYLIFSKYNDYKQAAGGTGINELAILDPFAAEFDALAGADRMKEILTIAGITPDGPPDGAVREWCINVAVVDPATHSILVNSEDGWLYRWDLRTNSFTQSVQLVSDGVLEAYTPTMVGPDGAIYAINRSRLFSVIPEPGTGLSFAVGLMPFLLRRSRLRRPMHSPIFRGVNVHYRL